MVFLDLHQDGFPNEARPWDLGWTCGGIPRLSHLLTTRQTKTLQRIKTNSTIFGKEIQTVHFFWCSPGYRLVLTPAPVLVESCAGGSQKSHEKECWICCGLALKISEWFAHDEFETVYLIRIGSSSHEISFGICMI